MTISSKTKKSFNFLAFLNFTRNGHVSIQFSSFSSFTHKDLTWLNKTQILSFDQTRNCFWFQVCCWNSNSTRLKNSSWKLELALFEPGPAECQVEIIVLTLWGRPQTKKTCLRSKEDLFKEIWIVTLVIIYTNWLLNLLHFNYKTHKYVPLQHVSLKRI